MLLKRPQSQAAFTLIDVMMGGAILMVGFIAVIQAVSLGTVMLDTARKQQIAQQVIDAEIENLRASTWTYVSSTLPASASITVNAAGTGVTNNTASASNYFLLPTNSSLLLQAKGFTCTLEAYDVRTNLRRVVIRV
ncbi:MAG TPA: hypothetical protein VFJ90_13405, partial [Candidatus Didemnitutus sp.]|nr:hypothetical protein [Candidatus Didemnitutus sp.]